MQTDFPKLWPSVPLLPWIPRHVLIFLQIHFTWRTTTTPNSKGIHSLYKYQVNPCWLTRYNAMGWEEHRIQWPGTWASESSRPVSKPQTGHRNSSHTNSASAVQSTSCALICLILAHYEQLIMLPFNRCERPGTEQLNNLPKLPELKGGRIGVFLKFYWYTIYIP